MPLFFPKENARFFLCHYAAGALPSHLSFADDFSDVQLLLSPDAIHC